MRELITIIFLSLLTSCAYLDTKLIDREIAKNPELKQWRQKAIDREVEIGFPQQLLRPIRIMPNGSAKYQGSLVNLYIYKKRILDDDYTRIFTDGTKVIAIIE